MLIKLGNDAEALTFNLVYASAYHQWEEDTLFTNKILKTI